MIGGPTAGELRAIHLPRADWIRMRRWPSGARLARTSSPFARAISVTRIFSMEHGAERPHCPNGAEDAYDML
jgi:hypothetical protein